MKFTQDNIRHKFEVDRFGRPKFVINNERYRFKADSYGQGEPIVPPSIIWAHIYNQPQNTGYYLLLF